MYLNISKDTNPNSTSITISKLTSFFQLREVSTLKLKKKTLKLCMSKHGQTTDKHIPFFSFYLNIREGNFPELIKKKT